MKNILDELTLEEKIGQRFIFGTNSDNIDAIVKLIENNYIGGVILYARNYDTYEDMLNVIKKLKTANKKNKIPLFIAIDQEAGKVDRTPDEVHKLKNVYDVSKTDPALIEDHAKIVGKILSDVGINMNFAPVLDIYNDSGSKAIYKRCFFGDADDVYKCGKVYINELKKQNIIPVVKHFPGHGSSKFDSHFMVPFVLKYKDVLNKHMKPFENAIKDGIDAIMIGHITVRKLTKGLPASISTYFINKILRDNLNYKGLVITDEINMLKRTGVYSPIYLKKALMSASDIVLVKVKTYDEGKKVLDKYKKLYHEEKLNDTVKRIVDLKNKHNINDNINYHGSNINEINNEIDRINKLILKDEEYQ